VVVYQARSHIGWVHLIPALCVSTTQVSDASFPVLVDFNWLPIALHMFWQVATLNPDDGDNALARFRSNRTAGLLMFLACLVVGNA